MGYTIHTVANEIVTSTLPENSLGEMVSREAGFHIDKNMTITGTGAIIANILQVTGTVVITNAWGLITRVGTLTNLTNLYFTLYDGSTSNDITADGSVLSNFPVGSYIVRDQDSTNTVTVVDATTCVVNETPIGKKLGVSFSITQGSGLNTYIRCHCTTTDNPVDFDIKLHIEYYPINSSTLTFL